MTKILQSFNPYCMDLPEVRIPDGRTLPAVILPKARYRPTECYVTGPRKGFPARPIAELTDLEQERLAISGVVQQLFDRGVYRWLDKIPESLQTTEDLVSDLRSENAALKAGNPKVDTKSSIVDAEKEALRSENAALKARIEALNEVNEAVVVPMVNEPRIGPDLIDPELKSMPYAKLQKVASHYGIKATGKRSDMEIAIMTAHQASMAQTPVEVKDEMGPSDPEVIV